MICPHCDKPLTADEVRSLWGALTSSLRVTRAGGARSIPTKCKSCGAQCPTVRASRRHCSKEMRKAFRVRRETQEILARLAKTAKKTN